MITEEQKKGIEKHNEERKELCKEVMDAYHKKLKKEEQERNKKK